MRESQEQMTLALEGRLYGIEIEVKEETKDIQAKVESVVEWWRICRGRWKLRLRYQKWRGMR